jgi:hypothetical protein
MIMPKIKVIENELNKSISSPKLNNWKEIINQFLIKKYI